MFGILKLFCIPAVRGVLRPFWASPRSGRQTSVGYFITIPIVKKNDHSFLSGHFHIYTKPFI